MLATGTTLAAIDVGVAGKEVTEGRSCAYYCCTVHELQILRQSPRSCGLWWQLLEQGRFIRLFPFMFNPVDRLAGPIKTVVHSLYLDAAILSTILVWIGWPQWVETRSPHDLRQPLPVPSPSNAWMLDLSSKFEGYSIAVAPTAHSVANGTEPTYSWARTSTNFSARRPSRPLSPLPLLRTHGANSIAHQVDRTKKMSQTIAPNTTRAKKMSPTKQDPSASQHGITNRAITAVIRRPMAISKIILSTPDLSFKPQVCVSDVPTSSEPVAACLRSRQVSPHFFLFR